MGSTVGAAETSTPVVPTAPSESKPLPVPSPTLTPTPAPVPTATPAPNPIASPVIPAVALNAIAVIINNATPQQLPVQGELAGTQASDLEQWLLPLDPTLKLLEIQQRQLPSGELELTSPYLLVRLNPRQWQAHPRLGQAITLGELRKLPGLKIDFDGKIGAIKFSYTLPKTTPTPVAKPIPVKLDGLAAIDPPTASLSRIQERINLSGTGTNQINDRGELKAVGTLFGSSWYLRVDQPKLSDLLTWGLSDATAINQNPSADWISGSQTPFWRRQGNPTGTYWGVTTIQRQDFTPPTSLYWGDFVTNERLQSNQLGRTVNGQAPPGTVVRLVKGLGNEVTGQALVDSSGIFRFDNVQVSNDGQFGNNYRLLLYPRGQLTADPQIRDVTFTTVPGQLPIGSGAWIASMGANYNRIPNGFIGSFDRLQGGVAYRRGVSESITVGGGLIYDPTIRGVGEVFWQPTGVPLQASVSAVTGDKWDVVSNLNYRPTTSLNANFSSDKFSTRADVNWQVAPQFTATSKYDSQSGAAIGGNYNFSLAPNSNSSIQGTFDTKSFLRWSANHQQENWQVSLQGNEISLNSEVTYRLPAPTGINQNLIANYQVTNQNTSSTNLSQVLWRYQAGSFNSELGYGWSGFGSGANAGLGLTLSPGLQLTGRYQGISAFSNQTNFSLEIQSSLDLQGGVRAVNTQPEDLRTRGGIVLQAFLDRNGNGKKDSGEEQFWHPALVMLDKKPLNSAQVSQSSERVEVRAAPGSYRLDLNPTHLPPHYRSSTDSLRVNVALGSYTTVPIPLTPIYTVTGIISNAAGQPLPGVEVVATHISSTNNSPPEILNHRKFTTTKADGSYELTDLARGTHQVAISGQPNPAIIAIVSESPVVQKLNLSISPKVLSYSQFVSDVQNFR